MNGCDYVLLEINIIRTEMNIGKLCFNVISLNQKDIGITVCHEYNLLIDALDSPEVYLLSSLIKHVNETNDVLLLHRENATYADLVIFNGAINPITKKIVKEIKNKLNFIMPTLYPLSLTNEHDESIWDNWKSWRYMHQIRLIADMNLVMINASKLGFEMLINSCENLAASYCGHTHYNWYSTKSSVELIIRNMARND